MALKRSIETNSTVVMNQNMIDYDVDEEDERDADDLLEEMD